MKTPRNAVVFINGRLVSADSACVPILDRGLAYGDGVFETMRAYGGQVFKLKEHLSRLLDGARALSIPVRTPQRKIAEAVGLVLRANMFSEAYVKVTLTRGVGSEL